MRRIKNNTNTQEETKSAIKNALLEYFDKEGVSGLKSLLAKIKHQERDELFYQICEEAAEAALYEM